MELLCWEVMTEGPDERTERLPVVGGWLYRTIVFVSRPDGERPRYIGATVDLTLVPGGAPRPRKPPSGPRLLTPHKLDSQA